MNRRCESPAFTATVRAPTGRAAAQHRLLRCPFALTARTALAALWTARSGRPILQLMADASAPDDPRDAQDSAILVRVTVVPGPRGGAGVGQTRLLHRRAPAVAALTLALLAGAVVGVASSRILAGPEPPLRAQAAQADEAGPAGVAAAYHYPLACLSVTIAAADPAYAAARLNRASPCWRYGVYSTTIFHRVAGKWRLVTSGASCSIASIPTVVRAEVGLCESGSAVTAPIASGRRRGLSDGPGAVLNDWDLPRALDGSGSES